MFLAACSTSEEDAESTTQGAETGSSSETADMSESGDDGTEESSSSGMGSGDVTSDGSTAGDGSGSSASSGGSGGQLECEAGREPAEHSMVAACPAVLGESHCSEGQAHVEDGSEIDWQSNPPHSGPHYPSWELWGEHDSTVPRGNWVHNLEHGGIVLAYSCPGGCDAELEVLREVVAQRPDSRILLTPDPLLPEPSFAAVSWTWVHRFETPELSELLCFVDQHFNHAPEDVP